MERKVVAVKPTTSMMMKKGDPAAKDSTTAGIDKTNTDQQQVLSLRNLDRDPLPSSQAGNFLTEPCLAKTSFKTSNVSSQMMPSHSALQTSSSSGSSLPLDESTHRLYRYQEMGDSYGSNLDLPCIEEQADDFQGLDHKNLTVSSSVGNLNDNKSNSSLFQNHLQRNRNHLPLNQNNNKKTKTGNSTSYLKSKIDMEGGRRLLCNSSLSPSVSASGSTSSSLVTQPPSSSSLTPSSSPPLDDSIEIHAPSSPPTPSTSVPMKLRDYSNSQGRNHRASISSCSSVESYNSSSSSGASSLYSSSTSHSSHDASLSSHVKSSITSRFHDKYNCSNSNNKSNSNQSNSNSMTSVVGKLDINRKWSPGVNSFSSNSNNNNSKGITTSPEISSVGVKSLQDRILNYKNAGMKDASCKQTTSSTSSENDSHPVRKSLAPRRLRINDLDFSDLNPDDDTDVLSLCSSVGSLLPSNSPLSIPPPPPPPPPPADLFKSNWKTSGSNVSGTLNKTTLTHYRSMHNLSFSSIDSFDSENQNDSNNSKNKKTVKLFWKEVKEEKSLLSHIKRKKTIWDEIKPVAVDVQKLQLLFENRCKEVLCKKTQEGKKSELLVLDAKRSNAINIGLTKLPAPRAVKNAILKMDSSIISREGIEKVLSMIPTEEEKNLILEAQNDNPDLPLGSAESFLQTLSTISALEQRLKLWAFRLDFDSTEKEMGEQLMDLKKAMEEIERSETFRLVLGTLLSMGNFLNGMEAKGFQLEYLAMVPKVKDTVYKHSLLYHVATFIYEKHPESSDLYSDLGAVCRASHIDFDEVSKLLTKLEDEAKVSWDRLRIICKNEPASFVIKTKMTDFLHECTDRISVLQVVQRRVFNRFRKTLLYLGFSSSTAKELKPNAFLKILAEFALEYKTTRDKVKEVVTKRESNREANKHRSKTPDSSLRSQQQIQDSELRQVLSGSSSGYDSDFSSSTCSGSLRSWSNSLSRSRASSNGNGVGGGTSSLIRGKSMGNLYTACNDSKEVDDDIIESLVKTLVTSTPTASTPASSFQRKRMQRMRKQSSSSSSTDQASSVPSSVNSSLSSNSSLGSSVSSATQNAVNTGQKSYRRASLKSSSLLSISSEDHRSLVYT